jgi:hypothetical protein
MFSKAHEFWDQGWSNWKPFVLTDMFRILYFRRVTDLWHNHMFELFTILLLFLRKNPNIARFSI